MSGFRHWKRAVLAALAAPGGVAGIGAAQEEAPVLPPPPVRGEPVVVRPVQAPTVRPVQPGQPSAREAVAGLEGRDLATPPAQMLRDGAFLSAERGVPLASPAGEWLVAFQHPDLPPMVLLPSRALERLIEEVEGREGAVAVRLSGQVTAFRGRNYLLPTLLSMEAAGIATDDGTPQTGIDEGEDANEGPPAEDLARGALEDRRVRDLMRELEEASRDVRESDRPLSPAVASVDEAAGAVEGGLLVRRRGRVVRLEGGRLAFAFDQDPQGRALPPMLMLPNVVLERMEAVARSSEREPPMVVSGRVHLYRGVPHLLVQAYALERGEQLRPMQ